MKYYVRLVRPRFETRLVEVEADEPQDAESRAMLQSGLPSRDWKLVTYDRTAYGAHVEGLISQDEVDDALGGDPDSDPREILASRSPFPAAAYLFMYADPESGEGQVVWEPWFGEVSILMQADLCEDWRQELEVLAPDDPFEGMDMPEEKKRQLAKILLFRKRRPRDDDDEPPTAA